jgi:hypothetical protein
MDRATPAGRIAGPIFDDEFAVDDQRRVVVK